MKYRVEEVLFVTFFVAFMICLICIPISLISLIWIPTEHAWHPIVLRIFLTSGLCAIVFGVATKIAGECI